MMWGANEGMGWWMIFGGIWMVIFWGAIIWLIVWGVGQVSGGGRRSEDTPLEIARTRYARHSDRPAALRPAGGAVRYARGAHGAVYRPLAAPAMEPDPAGQPRAGDRRRDRPEHGVG